MQLPHQKFTSDIAFVFLPNGASSNWLPLRYLHLSSNSFHRRNFGGFQCGDSTVNWSALCANLVWNFKFPENVLNTYNYLNPWKRMGLSRKKPFPKCSSVTRCRILISSCLICGNSRHEMRHVNLIWGRDRELNFVNIYKKVQNIFFPSTFFIQNVILLKFIALESFSKNAKKMFLS